MRIALVGLFAVIAGVALAQGQHMPRGVATDVTAGEIAAAVKKTATAPVSDQQLRVVAINNGEYNVGVGVVHRAKTNGQGAPGAGGGVEHSEITEVYHVISGNGTLVTGGTITGAKPLPADNPVVTTLNGPSTNGGPVTGGKANKMGPGDVIIIPPNTPHWWTEITSDQVVYLVVRADPHKILPAGYVLK